MAGVAHLGVGLAAKPLAPKVPLWSLLLASEAIDLLWGTFFLAKIEAISNSPWSHSLMMAAIWALVGGALAAVLTKNRRAGFVIGAVIFSHWVVDFITHPMTGGPPNLPLLLAGSPKVGLGFYSLLQPWPWLLLLIEFGSVLVGFGVYWKTRSRPLNQSV